MATPVEIQAQIDILLKEIEVDQNKIEKLNQQLDEANYILNIYPENTKYFI